MTFVRLTLDDAVMLVRCISVGKRYKGAIKRYDMLAIWTLIWHLSLFTQRAENVVFYFIIIR